ncbi:peptidylprolyl isomerase [uncultured Desulfosarcina sp.]|uniref:peptidylprolyl isomerase n=1 Tax=uncultured Desulfosarcina sp. TaxID=218289 RepID=UPI0029C7638C|nr:peptidylprolyl isomerase [uncultured Desulfosarcina sp.]
MIFLTRTLSAFAVSLALLLPTLPGHAAETQPQAGQIARVNDQMLMREDLDRELKLVSLRLTRQGRPVSEAQLKHYESDIRETLINRTLLLQQSKSAGVDVKESLVTKALGEFKAAFDGEMAYARALADMGFSEEGLKNQIRDGLAVKALIDDKVTRNISLSDRQVRAFYDENPDLFRQPEQVRASHILIQVPENADQEKKAKALAAIQALKARIGNGEDFAVLAMENSDCPSKAKGGDLGFFGREQMVKPFSDAAFALQPGQMSDVVETRFGYHLIRVTERKEEQTLPFNDVKEAIASRLRQEQEGKKIDAYIENLKEHADIKRFPL